MLAQRFCPVQSVARLVDLEPQVLVESGKRLVLMDADNTLVAWQSEEISDEARAWVYRAQALGLQVCLVSNTRNRGRLERLARDLGVKAAEGKFKPSREMYRWAMERYGTTPEQTVMIGDQVFTDVFGANRSGIEAILVRPMADREFIGTKFNRFLEKIVFRRLVHVMQAEDDDLPIVPKTGFFQRRIVRQFAKFAIVGGSSFVIDYCVRMTIAFSPQGKSAGQWMLDNFGGWVGFAQGKPIDAVFPVAAFIGGCVAMVNSFIWNRKWTFGIKNPAERAAQFKRFVAVSVSGVCLNALITGTVNALLHMGDDKVSARIATLVATAVVAFWNFFGQRLFAFRPREEAA